MDASGCLIGGSRAICELRHDVALAAQSTVKVLISGEAGLGKKSLAGHIHQQSGRATGPFVVLNCASAEDAAQLHGYLFGRPAGHAKCDSPRLIEAANRGTLLFDAVSEMTPSVQRDLLGFVDQLNVRHESAKVRRRLDVRVIACALPRITDRLTTGEFSDDLYYRLSTIHLRVPALRERPEDIRALVQYFLRQTAAAKGQRAPDVSHEAMTRLISYQWPGNVNEVKRVIEALVSDGRVSSTIHARHLPEELMRVGSIARDKPTPTAVPSKEMSVLLEHAAAATNGPSMSPVEIQMEGESLLEFNSELSEPSTSATITPVHSAPEDPALAESGKPGSLAPRGFQPLQNVVRRRLEYAAAILLSVVAVIRRTRLRATAAWTECVAAMKHATVHFISAMNPSTVARQYHNLLRHRIESLQGYVGSVRESALALLSLAIAFSRRPQVREKAGRERTFAPAALGGDALTVSRGFVSSAKRLGPSLMPFGCGAVIGGVIVFVVSAMPRPGQPIASMPRPGEKRTPASDGYAYVVDQQAEVRAGAGRGTERLLPLVAISTVNSDRLVPIRQPRPMESAPSVPSAPFRGSLAVTSRPSGARVSLNGRPAGTTPLVLRNLPVGSRAVRLELDRYQPWSSAIRVITNQQARVMVDLHPTGAP